jgi:hypothetical protein
MKDAIRFVRRSGIYGPNDIAAFAPAVSASYVRAGVAVRMKPEGQKTADSPPAKPTVTQVVDQDPQKVDEPAGMPEAEDADEEADRSAESRKRTRIMDTGTKEFSSVTKAKTTRKPRVKK